MGRGMWRVPFHVVPHFDRTKPVVMYLLYKHPFLNGSRRKCLSSSSVIGYCHFYLWVPRFSPPLSCTASNLHFFTLPGFFSAVPCGDLWVAVSISQLLSDYLHWWQTLSHQLSRGTQRHLICNSIPFPIQYFGSSTAPHFSSASVSTISWSGTKFLHLIWHCL